MPEDKQYCELCQVMVGKWHRHCRVCEKLLPRCHVPIGVCVDCVMKNHYHKVNIPNPGYKYGPD